MTEPNPTRSLSGNLVDVLSQSSADAAQCEQLQSEVGRLAAAVADFRGLLGPLGWSEAVGLEALQAKLHGLAEQIQQLRSGIAKLAGSDGEEPPSWADEASLASWLGQKQMQFHQQRATHIREIYQRVASQLSAAKVEHSSPRIQQMLEQLLQESIDQLNELAGRSEVPDPPSLWHETRWWNSIGKGEPIETHVAAVQPYSPSLADLLCELSRVRFADDSESAVTEVDEKAEIAATSLVEPASQSELPPESHSDVAAEGSVEADTTAPPAEPHSAAPNGPLRLLGARRCKRCGAGDNDILPSNMRLLEAPLLLLNSRYHRCRICGQRFLGWK